MIKYHNRWLTPIELYQEYGFSVSWQAKARMLNSRVKGFPYVKVGKFIRYDRFAIDVWIEEHNVRN